MTANLLYCKIKFLAICTPLYGNLALHGVSYYNPASHWAEVTKNAFDQNFLKKCFNSTAVVSTFFKWLGQMDRQMNGHSETYIPLKRKCHSEEKKQEVHNGTICMLHQFHWIILWQFLKLYKGTNPITTEH